MSKHLIPEEERYSGPVKWFQYICARVLIFGFVHLPMSFSYRIGRGIGWLSWKLLVARREVVRKNLTVVNEWMAEREDCESPLPAKSAGLALEEQVKEVFMRSGANLLASFSLSRLSPRRMEQHLYVQGFEHLREALQYGKGAIMLLSHMGPWEVLTHLPQIAAGHGVVAPLAAMYRPLNNTYLDRWMHRQREAMGTRLFSRRDGFHRPVDFIRKGGVLGILADQKMRQGERVPFFGLECKTSPIAGLFHRRSGAPMLALSIETVGFAKWKLTVDSVDLTEVPDQPSREALCLLCNQALEQVLARSPCDGFWLSKRF
ncbi:MAG: hypothetical protein CML13_05615 [Puniceicoccaceae bacterium]|nr:hypothetical protein [Puniceicoccaceae bacterium]|tara:strand:- start:10578 stop:11528 length:951 start_codon:yes stop_codon:yes gene_type:complete